MDINLNIYLVVPTVIPLGLNATIVISSAIVRENLGLTMRSLILLIN